MLKNALALSLVIALWQCKSPRPDSSHTHADLGELQYQFDINPTVKDDFDKGLLLLHNFEYDDARKAFKEGLEKDDAEIMLHWGEAMTIYKALWGLQDEEEGRKIMERLGSNQEERLAGIVDPLERDFWQSIEIIYGEGTANERNKKYADYMQDLHKKYPNHQEVAAFYALGLIWATEEYGDGSDDLLESARIADEILDNNANHPGALHYKIHALDGPVSASKAQAAADAYAKVAPDAAHALHMPSHIYLALGHWDDVVSSNEASYAASVKRMEKLSLTDGARGYHSYAWLHYGLLQQGRHEHAAQILKDMLTYVPEDPTKGARIYLLGMQNRQLVETGNLDPELNLDLEVKVDDLGLEAQAMLAFLRAQVLLKNGDVNAVEKEITWLSDQRLASAALVGDDGLSMCSSGATRYAPTQNILNQTDVIIAQMKAMLMQAQDNKELFVEHMELATSLEATTEYPTGPPRVALPSFEQYGAWLLKSGSYEKALAMFDLSLERTPRRTKSLQGKMEALKGLERSEEALQVEKELLSIWKMADPSIKELIASI